MGGQSGADEDDIYLQAVGRTPRVPSRGHMPRRADHSPTSASRRGSQPSYVRLPSIESDADPEEGRASWQSVQSSALDLLIRAGATSPAGVPAASATATAGATGGPTQQLSRDVVHSPLLSEEEEGESQSE